MLLLLLFCEIQFGNLQFPGLHCKYIYIVAFLVFAFDIRFSRQANGMTRSYIINTSGGGSHLVVSTVERLQFVDNLIPQSIGGSQNFNISTKPICTKKLIPSRSNGVITYNVCFKHDFGQAYSYCNY